MAWIAQQKVNSKTTANNQTGDDDKVFDFLLQIVTAPFGSEEFFTGDTIR